MASTLSISHVAPEAGKALTADNLVAAVQCIEDKWDQLGDTLFIPEDVRKKIHRSHSQSSDRLAAVFKYVLELDPYASWRSLVRALDKMREHKLADSIRIHVEPVPDATLTIANVSFVVMETVKEWDDSRGLADSLLIPYSIQTEIRRKNVLTGVQKKAAMEYWLSSVSNASWHSLAGALYELQEEQALEIVERKFIHKVEDDTLNVPNLLKVTESLTDLNLLNIWLGVPGSKSEAFSSKEERRVSLFSQYLRLHPAPSWRGIAWVLFVMDREQDNSHRALKKIYDRKFLTSPGEPRHPREVVKPVVRDVPYETTTASDDSMFSVSMTTPDLCTWLKRKSVCDKDIVILKAQDVDGATFVDLPRDTASLREDLPGLTLGGRNKILRLVEEVHSKEKKGPRLAAPPFKLKKLIDALWDARACWYTLAMQLDISEGDRNAIKTNHDGVEERFTKMFELWHKGSQSLPAVIDALESNVISRGDLAKELRQMIINNTLL